MVKKHAEIKSLEYEDATRGILNGKCYFFPVNDWRLYTKPVQCSLWWKMGYYIYEQKLTGALRIGFEGAQIDDDDVDNKRGRVFRAWARVEMAKVYAPFFREHNDLVFLGGFRQELHDSDFNSTALSFEVWDVYDAKKRCYVDYGVYSKLLDLYKINYLQAIGEKDDPSYEDVIQIANGAEVVIKNYSFKGPNGDVWAKYKWLNKDYYAYGFYLTYKRHNTGESYLR